MAGDFSYGESGVASCYVWLSSLEARQKFSIKPLFIFIIELEEL